MEWIVIEGVDDAGARLTALRLSDGATRLLFATEQPAPLHASLHPQVTRVAIDAVSRGAAGGRSRSRVGIVNLERPGVGWLRQSLDPQWRVGHAVFDDSGSRLALEGAWDGVPISDIYVYALTFSGNSVREEVLAGAGNPSRMGCRQPLFVDGGKQLLYLRNTLAEGAWEVCVIDLERDGDSASLLEGRAPSVLALTLTEGADAVPDIRLCYCGAIKQVFWVGRTRGATRHQVRTARLGVRPHTDLGPTHLKVEELCVARGGELLAASADGQIWLTDVETGATVAIVQGDHGVSHRGLAFDEAEGRLLFCTNGAAGAQIRSVDLATRAVTTLHELGDVAIVALHGVIDDAAVWARLEGFTSVAAPARPDGDATAVHRIDGMDDPDVFMGRTEDDASTWDGSVEMVVEDPTLEQRLADLDADGETRMEAAPDVAAPAAPAEPAPPPDPQVDFGRWMRHVGGLDDPDKALKSLEKIREDAGLREAARMYLGTQRRRAAGREDVPVPLLQAIVAAAHLHLNEARGELLELCRRGRPRVDDGGLLETDEHFALAALLYIDGHSPRFSWSKIYRDYEGMLVKINEVLEDEGEGAATRIMAAFAEGYSRQIAGVLAVLDPTATPTFDARKFREQSLAQLAAQATMEEEARRQMEAEEAALREAAEAEARAAEEAAAEAEAQAAAEAARLEAERLEAERREAARLEAERREAARREAAEEARRQAEQRRRAEEEEARRKADEARRKAEEEQRWEAQRRRAEEEARAAEERAWAERRAAMEQAEAEANRQSREARQAAEEAAERARADAAAKIAAAERAAREAEAALAAAEAAARLQDVAPPSAPRAATPTARASGGGGSPFNPLAGASTPPRPMSRPEPGRAAPDFGASRRADDFAADESVDLPAAAPPPGAAPPIVPIAGLFAAASGLSLTILGLTGLGGLVAFLGIIWVAGGGGLFADRRWGWLLALAGYGLNAIGLIALGVGPLPEWLSGALFVLWGIAAAGLGAALLHPNLRARFGPGRRKF